MSARWSGGNWARNRSLEFPQLYIVRIARQGSRDLSAVSCLISFAPSRLIKMGKPHAYYPWLIFFCGQGAPRPQRGVIRSRTCKGGRPCPPLIQTTALRSGHGRPPLQVPLLITPPTTVPAKRVFDFTRNLRENLATLVGNLRTLVHWRISRR